MLLVLITALAGCAGSAAFRDGNALIAQGRFEEGLARLDDAVREAPDQVAYQTALRSRRAALVQELILAGDRARLIGQTEQARTAFGRALTLDAGAELARQRLSDLEQQAQADAWVADMAAGLARQTEAQLKAALRAARDLLARVPNHAGARQLSADIGRRLAATAGDASGLAARYRKPVTLEFRDAPLKAVLEVLSAQTGIRVFYDRDVEGGILVTLFARETSVEETLRMLLRTNQLTYKVLNERGILIFPDTPQKQKQYRALSVRAFYLTNADVNAVANTLRTIVKSRDLIIDERLGIIFMRDTPEAIRMAERIVALQDLGDAEVMLEVEILEVNRRRLTELGVQWPGSLSLTPLPRTGQTLLLSDLGRLSSHSTQASIDPAQLIARAEDGDVNVLANPRIRVRNKEKASIRIGDRVPIFTTTVSGTTGFAADSVTYLDVGLKLEVAPRIHLDGEVAIKVDLEVSTLGAPVTSRSGTRAHQIGTRGASTTLRLRDGETQILAGLIEDSDRANAAKVPFLGDIPLLGRLFGTRSSKTERNEILLSITPRILRTVALPAQLDIEFDSGTDNDIGSLPLALPPARHSGQEGDAGAAVDASPVADRR
jgi:general secretion pathway protein D